MALREMCVAGDVLMVAGLVDSPFMLPLVVALERMVILMTTCHSPDRKYTPGDWRAV